MKNNIIILVLIAIITPQICFAYVGPGLAGSTILMVLGLVASLFLAILAVVYYPIKRLLKKNKKKQKK